METPELRKVVFLDRDGDLLSSVMIGDREKDIGCARAAGCGCSILVRTGSGRQAEKEPAEKLVFLTWVAADLLVAALWLIKNHDSDPAA
ncbi:MAG: HAD hydrolase-like protein [Thermodesulfobacteriota bacterium]|nr:HAD hydrolase-like protein [Thermodesulfobacteriota bacterium]